MPDALIVCERDHVGKINRYGRILLALERKGIISSTTVKGEKIYGRAYLPPKALRNAYYLEQLREEKKKWEKIRIRAKK